MLNVTQIGTLVAEFMEDLEQEYNGQAPTVGTVAVIVEINFVDEDGDKADAIRFRCSDGRRWVQAGIFESAKFAAQSSE